MELRPCGHSGPIESDGRRACALGLFGGRVKKREECQGCDKHTARAGDAAPRTEKPKPAPAVPCGFRGDETTPPAGTRRSLKVWVECLHPEQPLGPAVCSCEGCGPKCLKYDGGSG